MSQSESQFSDVVGDHRVRIMEINEDEQAIIRVRTKFHVSLVFGSCTIDLFEKDGVVFTRHESTITGDNDDDSVGGIELDGNADTQEMLGDTHIIESYQEEGGTQIESFEEEGGTQGGTQLLDDFITPELTDPPDIVRYAGGDFTQVNEKHAFRLGMDDMDKDFDTVRESLCSQFDCVDGQEVDVLYDYEETQDESMYTSGGIYIPSYLRLREW
jgi:hypothetical protein